MFEDIVKIMPYAAVLNLALASLAMIYAWYIRMPCYHPLVLFQVYFFLGFGLRPLAIANDGGSHVWERIGIDLSSSDGIKAILVAFIFWLAFTSVGFFLANSSKTKQMGLRIPPRNIGLKVKHQKLFNIACYILIIVGVVVTWKMISGRGTSIYSFQTEVDSSGKQRMVGQSGYFTMMAEWPIIGILLLILNQGVTRLNTIIIFLFAALRVFVGAQRLSFVAVAIILCFFLLIREKKLWPPRKFLIPAFIILFVFNLVGSDRLMLERISKGEEHYSALFAKQEDTGMSKLAEHTAHFVEFDMLCEVVSVVPEPLGYNYFSQYGRIFVWPIPRQIWKEKPVVTSLVNFSKLGNFYALTLSCIGDSYTNLGIWGTWIMAMVWSYLLCKIYSVMVHSGGAYICILFFTICGYISTVFRDGGVTAFYFILVTIVPGYAVIYICGQIPQNLPKDRSVNRDIS